jgi:hypothetical protein
MPSRSTHRRSPDCSGRSRNTPTKAAAIRRSSSFTAIIWKAVNHSYKRYLENIFRTTFNLQGTPLRVEFKSGHNPFESRDVKPLTPRQERTAQRDKKRRPQHLR